MPRPIPLDNTLLRLTGWKMSDQAQIAGDGLRLIITPAKTGIGKERLLKSLAVFRTLYSRALAELAK